MENAVSMTFIIFTDSAPIPKSFRYDFTFPPEADKKKCFRTAALYRIAED
jgi:hypothetical protein